MRQLEDGVPTYRRLGKRWRRVVPVMAGVTTVMAALQIGTGTAGWPTTALVALLYVGWALRLSRPLLQVHEDRIDVRNLRQLRSLPREDVVSVGLRRGTLGFRSPVLRLTDGTEVAAIALPPGLALARPEIAQQVAEDLGVPVLGRGDAVVAEPS